MKKIVSLLLSIMLILSLTLFTACDSSSGNSSDAATCRHTETETEIDVPATCTTDGSQTTVCKKCGKKISTTKIDKLGHEYAAGFCIRTGCSAVDANNNRFYANTLVSILDTTYYSLANVGDITVTYGNEIYTFKNVNILGGKSEGSLETTDSQPLADDLLSVKISGESTLDPDDDEDNLPIDATVRLVNTDSELKLIVVFNGEEKVYARVDNEAVVKTIEFLKDTVTAAGGAVSGTGITGSGTETGYADTIKDLIAEIRTADGDDTTVAEINKIIHNLVVALADINKVPEGYEIALSTEKMKDFNLRLATQNVEDLITDLFGAGAYKNFTVLLQMMANAGQSGAESSVVPSGFPVEELIKDCSTLSLYDIVKKYTGSDTDYKAEVNAIIDAFDGLSLSCILDEKGNLLKSKIKAENFMPLEVTESDLIGSFDGIIDRINIDGEFEINYKCERITGDEYADFDNLLKTSDTDKEAGGYDGFIYDENDSCKKITYTVNENGNIVSATSYFAVNDSDNVTKYYKVVCSDPVMIERQPDEDGNTVYTFTNIFVEKNYSVDLGITVYVTDSNWENETLATDEAVAAIKNEINYVEFTLVAKVSPETSPEA